MVLLSKLGRMPARRARARRQNEKKRKDKKEKGVTGEYCCATLLREKKIK